MSGGNGSLIFQIAKSEKKTSKIVSFWPCQKPFCHFGGLNNVRSNFCKNSPYDFRKLKLCCACKFADFKKSNSYMYIVHIPDRACSKIAKSAKSLHPNWYMKKQEYTLRHSLVICFFNLLRNWNNFYFLLSYQTFCLRQDRQKVRLTDIWWSSIRTG